MAPSKSQKLEDQAATAALYVTKGKNGGAGQSKKPSNYPLDEDNKLSSAGAAASLTHASPRDLPAYPVVGLDNPESSAGAAASLANANHKDFELWKTGDIPAANKAANLAKDYKMEPLWHPELSAAGSKAALLAAEDGGHVNIWRPHDTDAGHSAAGQAMRMKGLSPQLDYGHTEEGGRRAMMAATGAMSSGRKRAGSTPTAPGGYPDSANSAANALKAATSAGRPTRGQPAPAAPITPAFNAARVHNQAITNMSREMYTSHPPVAPEVEEQNRQTTLHAAAVAMAKKMYDLQQKKLEEAAAMGRSDSQYGATSALNRPESTVSDDSHPIPQYANLQEAAKKLAAERLAKLHDEHAAYRTYYGTQAEPHSRKLSIRGRTRRRASSDGQANPSDEERSRQIRNEMSLFTDKLAQVDNKKRQKDRDSLLAAAQRNVRASMHAQDERVFNETGKVSPAMMEEWEAKARAKAEAESSKRLANHGMVNIGGGRFLDQSEVDAIAAAKVQPTLDEITVTAEKHRARDEELRQQQLEREQVAAEKVADDKERAAITKEEWKRFKEEEKREARAKKDEEKAKKAEEKRLQEEKRAEEKRLQDEKKAEEKRLRDQEKRKSRDQRATLKALIGIPNKDDEANEKEKEKEEEEEEEKDEDPVVGREPPVIEPIPTVAPISTAAPVIVDEPTVQPLPTNEERIGIDPTFIPMSEREPISAEEAQLAMKAAEEPAVEEATTEPAKSVETEEAPVSSLSNAEEVAKRVFSAPVNEDATPTIMADEPAADAHELANETSNTEAAPVIAAPVIAAQTASAPISSSAPAPESTPNVTDPAPQTKEPSSTTQDTPNADPSATPAHSTPVAARIAPPAAATAVATGTTETNISGPSKLSKDKETKGVSSWLKTKFSRRTSKPTKPDSNFSSTSKSSATTTTAAAPAAEPSAPSSDHGDSSMREVALAGKDPVPPTTAAAVSPTSPDNEPHQGALRPSSSSPEISSLSSDEDTRGRSAIRLADQLGTPATAHPLPAVPTAQWSETERKREGGVFDASLRKQESGVSSAGGEYFEEARDTFDSEGLRPPGAVGGEGRKSDSPARDSRFVEEL